MGISLERNRAHVAQYQAQFANYQKAWPPFLFRHEPVENAIEILKAGYVLSRADAEGQGAVRNDIAPEAIIQNMDAAHHRVRLYFRPRTPTQFHIEGIRKPANYYQGKHAGFLVMLVFNSERVLTTEGTQFSCGNMQSGASRVLDGDGGFDQLDFSGIYHDVAYPTPDQIRQRCAEVLPESPFALNGALARIVVRTDADVLTVKYLLAREGLDHLLPIVRKSHGPGIFFHKYTALDFVDPAPGRINFQLRYSESEGDIETKMTLVDLKTGHSKVLALQGLKGLTRYYTEHGAPPGQYRLSVQLEACFAHESIIELPDNQ